MWHTTVLYTSIGAIRQAMGQIKIEISIPNDKFFNLRNKLLELNYTIGCSTRFRCLAVGAILCGRVIMPSEQPF